MRRVGRAVGLARLHDVSDETAAFASICQAAKALAASKTTSKPPKSTSERHSPNSSMTKTASAASGTMPRSGIAISAERRGNFASGAPRFQSMIVASPQVVPEPLAS
jgi:hypothetical protein